MNLGSLAPILPYSAPGARGGCSPCTKSGDAANQRRVWSATPTNIANQNAAPSLSWHLLHPLLLHGAADLGRENHWKQADTRKAERYIRTNLTPCIDCHEKQTLMTKLNPSIVRDEARS